MNDFDQEMRRRLAQIEADGLLRQLRPVTSAQSTRVTLATDGHSSGARSAEQSLLNFSSNDYLGLANEPILKEAAIEAVRRFGAGSGASRLICGSIPPHRDLEEALASFKNTEAALSFSSGYATALGTIGALAGKQDIIVLDKLVHASIVDAARVSGATLRVFPHNNLDRLEAILKWASSGTTRTQSGKVLVITESVFSMDGDRAPLRELVKLKDRYGAWLMVDEAHATGVLGPTGRGLGEEEGVAERVEVQMGTLGKALGSAGGFICGSRPLIDLLVNRARSFIFSTAPVPAAAAAAACALRFVQSPEGAQRRAALWGNLSRLAARLGIAPPASAIIPVLVGDEGQAVRLSRALRDRGFLVPGIRYPTVARGRAMLRVTLTAAHSHSEIDALADCLRDLGFPHFAGGI